MIIGVDAGALSITDERLKVGVWRVTYNLLKELAEIDTKNEYRLYSFLPITEQFGTNFKNIVVRPRFGWSRISLPIELRLHPVDVFLGLSQMVPFCSAKKIGFIYDLAFLRYPEAYPKSLEKLRNQTKYLIEQSDTIVTISEASKKEIGKSNIVVAYPGVDPRFSRQGKKHHEKRPYVLMVGALKRIKNIPLAMRIIKETPYDLVLVGGNYWEDPAIGKEVKRTGYISDRELAEYYRGARALLVTSLWEGFCLPAVEALACGCPVVYKKTGSLPEIIGKDGMAFDTEKQAVHALLRVKKLKAKRQYLWSDFAKKVYEVL